MPSYRRVTARKPGYCSQEFAHAGEIQTGDLIVVVTYFPSDELCSSFGVPAFTRARVCAWCLARNDANGFRDYPSPDARARGGAPQLVTAKGSGRA